MPDGQDPHKLQHLPSSFTLKSDASGAGQAQITATIAAMKTKLHQKSGFCFAQVHFRLIQFMSKRVMSKGDG